MSHSLYMLRQGLETCTLKNDLIRNLSIFVLTFLYNLENFIENNKVEHNILSASGTDGHIIDT